MTIPARQRDVRGDGSGASVGPTETELQAVANRLRRRIIDMLWHSQAGHPGGSLSAVEIFTALYFAEMRIDPRDPGWPERDRFVLSKGHAAPVYYATLMERGYFPEDLLDTYDEVDSCLQAHPDVTCPGVDMPSGSLGQGLSMAIGLALGARLAGLADVRVYTLMGDGEQQEGQVWEGAMAAAGFRLDTVTAFIDCNRLQLYGPVESLVPVEPLRDKWGAFGWNVLEVDGHSIAQLRAACAEARSVKGRPTVVLAHTTKGKGVSFMEDSVEWHSAPVSDEVRGKALDELGGAV